MASLRPTVPQMGCLSDALDAPTTDPNIRIWRTQSLPGMYSSLQESFLSQTWTMMLNGRFVPLADG